MGGPDRRPGSVRRVASQKTTAILPGEERETRGPGVRRLVLAPRPRVRFATLACRADMRTLTVSPVWIAVAALGGLAMSPLQRAIVFASAVPSGSPFRRGCPSCGECAIPGRFWPPLAATWVTGRCRGCRSRIGLRPLVLELITAALLAGLAVRARSVGELTALCLLAAAGVALGFIDAAVHRLPDLLTLPLYAGVTVLLVAAAAAGHHWAALLRAALAGAVLACFFFALIIVIPAGIGAGDAKLGLAVGSVLGWYGWPVLVSGTFYAFLAAAAYALGLLVLRRASRQDSFAFVILSLPMAVGHVHDEP